MQQIMSDAVSLGVKFSADGITVIHDSPIVGGYVLKQAVLFMIGNNKILGNARVDYFAGKSVVLNPGFEVQTESVFNAKIQSPCTQQVQDIAEIKKF